MTKTPTAVFKCLQPELLDAHEKHTEEVSAAYLVKTRALIKEWGVEQLCQNSNYDGNWITGYVPATYQEAPKPGFRKDRNTGYMVPAKRTAEGKALVQRLKDVQYRPDRKPGLPKMVWGEGFMGGVTLTKLSGVWFAYVTVPLGDREPNSTGMSEVDPAIWEPVKLSEYFLAAEAEEAKL